MNLISKEDFNDFVNALIKDESWNVIGVKAKGSKFAFGPLESASELRLDYDVTLLPPKKYFFPQRETLFTYNLAGGFSAKNPAETKPAVIIGVHPYDIVAFFHMDEIFRETKSDPYYFKKRESSIIIGVNIQKMSKWTSPRTWDQPLIDYGYDLMLTDLGNRYAISIGSKKGEELLAKYAKNVTCALARDIQLVGQKKREIMDMAQQKFDFPPELIPELLKKDLWRKADSGRSTLKSAWHAAPAFSCARHAIALTSKRTRIFPLSRGRESELGTVACLKISRRLLQERTSAQQDRQGTGTGTSRRASTCSTDSASYPASAAADVPQIACQTSRTLLTCSTTCIKRRHEGGQSDPAATTPEVNIQTEGNIDYVPRLATIIKKETMTANEIFFELKLDDGSELGHKPGQFVEVSVFGIGEAPISISSSPTKKGVV